MDTLKFGQLAVEVEQFDLGFDAVTIKNGTSTLPAHEQSLIKAMDALRRVHVMTYNCTTSQMSGVGAAVDAQGRFRVSQELSVAGLDASGAHTKEASKALYIAFSDASGSSDGLAFDAKQNERFGTYTQTVPFEKFLQDFGIKISFDIYANVSYLSFRIKPVAGMPRGSAFLSVPYDLYFYAIPTFDCTQDISLVEDPEKVKFDDPHDLDPRDEGLRDILRPVLKGERATQARVVRDTKAVIQIMRERFEGSPWEEDLLWEIAQKNKELHKAKARLKQIDERIAKYDPD